MSPLYNAIPVDPCGVEMLYPLILCLQRASICPITTTAPVYRKPGKAYETSRQYYYMRWPSITGGGISCNDVTWILMRLKDRRQRRRRLIEPARWLIAHRILVLIFVILSRFKFPAPAVFVQFVSSFVLMYNWSRLQRLKSVGSVDLYQRPWPWNV